VVRLVVVVVCWARLGTLGVDGEAGMLFGLHEGDIEVDERQSSLYSCDHAIVRRALAGLIEGRVNDEHAPFLAASSQLTSKILALSRSHSARSPDPLLPTTALFTNLQRVYISL
jgi:hypothetical protein